MEATNACGVAILFQRIGQIHCKREEKEGKSTAEKIEAQKDGVRGCQSIHPNRVEMISGTIMTIAGNLEIAHLVIKGYKGPIGTLGEPLKQRV